MGNMASSIPDPKYKAILVKNETSNATVTLFLYARYDPICGMPFKWKTIEPGKQYFYRDKKKYKYQLKSQQKEETKENLQEMKEVGECVDGKGKEKGKKQKNHDS